MKKIIVGLMMLVPLLASARGQIDYVEVDTILAVYHDGEVDGLEEFACEYAKMAASGSVYARLIRYHYDGVFTGYSLGFNIKTQRPLFCSISDDSCDNTEKFSCIFRGAKGIVKKKVCDAWQRDGENSDYAHIVVEFDDNKDLERLRKIGTLKSFEVYDSKGGVILSRTFLSRAQPFVNMVFAKYIRTAKNSIDFYIECND